MVYWFARVNTYTQNGYSLVIRLVMWDYTQLRATQPSLFITCKHFCAQQYCKKKNQPDLPQNYHNVEICQCHFVEAKEMARCRAEPGHVNIEGYCVYMTCSHDNGSIY